MIDEKTRLALASQNDLYALGLYATCDVEGISVFVEATGQHVSSVPSVDALYGFVEGFRSGRELDVS